jgi:hypothetical protein
MANTTSLAGLSKDILREKYILEGFKIYLEALDPEYFKLLTESNNSDILLENKLIDLFNKAKSQIQKTRLADFFRGVNLLSKEVPQVIKLIPQLSKEVSKLDPKKVYSLLNSFKKEKTSTTEVANSDGNNFYTSPSDRKNYPILYQISRIAMSTKAWAKTTAFVVLVSLMMKLGMGNFLMNREIEQAAKDDTSVEYVTDATKTYPPDDDGTFKAASDDLKKNKVDVPDADEEGTKITDDNGKVTIEKTKHVAIKSPYGKGKTFDDKGEEDVDEITKTIVDELKSGKKVKIQVAGTVSNTTGDDEKATDTNEKLTQARADHFKSTVLDGLKKSGLTEEQLKNLTIEVIKASPSSNQVQEPKGGSGASGVFITFTTEGGKTYKLNWDNWPEWGAWGVIDFMNPEGGDETPKPDGDKTNITPIPPIAGDDFSKLNRNGQIATVLAGINPKLNIAQYKEIGPIKSYTDNELLNPNIKDEKAKELARLIVNIRKNPNSLLKKVSGATGIPFNVRAKAVSTKASKSTQAQLQSPTVKETQELFQEALVDDIFTKLGIQDSDLVKNKIKLAGYLGSMYAKEGDTDLSILDTDKLSDDDKKELQKVGFGFTPQSGNNYVFLKGKSAADIGVTRTNKVQADTTRVLNTINRNTSLKTSLKRINTKDELKELIKAIIGYINSRLKQTPGQIKTDLITIRNTYKAPNKPLKEEEKALNLPDINNAIKLIDSYSGLKTELDRINTREELVQLLKGIIAFLDPALASRETDVKAAFQGAASSITNKALEPWKGDGKNKKNPPTTPTPPTTEIQRMQELAGLK